MRQSNHAQNRLTESELAQNLEKVKLHKALVLEGDVENIRHAVSAFNLRSAKHFVVRVREEDGKIFAIRTDIKLNGE